MTITINGTTGIAGVDGSASTPAVQGTDTNTGIVFPAADTVAVSTGGSERMRITSTGELLVGGTTAITTDRPAITLQGTGATILGFFRDDTTISSGNGFGQIIFYGNDTTSNTPVGHAAIVAIASGTHGPGDNPTDIYFSTTPSGSATQTERARITSGGNLLVGTTTAQGRLTITGSTSDATAYTLTTEAADGTDQLRVRCDGAVYMGLDGSSPYNLTNGAAANAVLLSDGFLYRSTSSLRYKKEIQDATHGLAEVLTLRPVTYKGTSSSDGENIYGGFIAEEVHAVGLTEFVQYDNDGQPDALHYGNMVSLMAKAIQEQQALITALTARIAALEAN